VDRDHAVGDPQDERRGGVAGTTITFTLKTTTYSDVTDASGVATVSPAVKAPMKTGTYSIAVKFTGDATYAAATTSGTLVVNQDAARPATTTVSLRRGVGLTLTE
jgi:archaellum component FlaG (FlaF/FlaG flagellin family)